MAETAVLADVGQLLKRWRGARRLSQLDLALTANVSSRHLSFVETGRSRPSREMVLQLARALELPLRECNRLLTAAGYAHLYRETGLEAPPMAEIRRALDYMLRAHEPYPALVMDRRWNLVMANGPLQRLIGQLLDPAALAGEGPPNILRLVFQPGGFRPHIVNWEQMAHHLLERAHRQALDDVADAEIEALIDAVLAMPGVPQHWGVPDPEASSGPVVAMHLRRGDLDLRLFSTVATFGTPQDVTLQELHIESFYPADRASEEALRRLAG